MRDEKVCPSCGGDLVWEGNVLDGALACPACREGAVVGIALDGEAHLGTSLEYRTQILKNEEDDGLMFSPETRAKLVENIERSNDLFKRMSQDWCPEKYEQAGDRVKGRQTGKTHGMVLRALDVADRGNMVVILAPGQQMKKYIENILDKLGVQCRHYGLYEVGGGSLRVVSVVNSLHGFRKDATVFADHTLFSHSWGPSVSDWFDDWSSRYEIHH